MDVDRLYDSKLSDFYKETAKTESNKFDDRLFWFTGGVAALSLGYFQATGTLHCDLVLIFGYAFLLTSIAVMLAGLMISSSVSNELAIWYGEKANQGDMHSDEEIKANIDKQDARERKIAWINAGALILSLAGVVLIVVYMFLAR